MSHLNLSPTSLRRLRRAAPARRQRGFSLLEALVSIVVLSFGLLGVAGLQASALKYSRDARNQSVAINLAREMAEMIRSNARVSGVAGSPYLLAAQTAQAVYGGTAPTTADDTIGPFTDEAGDTPGTALATAQVRDWAYRFDQALPGAYVAVCKDSQPYDTDNTGGNHKGAPHWNCNNTGDIIVIKMGWEREDAQGVVKGATEAWTGETVARPFIVLPVTPAGQH